MLRLFSVLLLVSGCVDYSDLSSDHPDASANDLRNSLAPPDLDPAGDPDLNSDINESSDLASTLHPDLAQAPADLSKPCVSTLSGTGDGDFIIRFRIATTAEAASAIIFQRSGCGDPLQDYWDVSMLPLGALDIAFGDGNPQTGGSAESELMTPGTINDGNPHDVVITRTNLNMVVTIDGAVSISGAAPASLGTLPTIMVGSGDPCGIATMVGTITNICLQQ